MSDKDYRRGSLGHPGWLFRGCGSLLSTLLIHGTTVNSTVFQFDSPHSRRRGRYPLEEILSGPPPPAAPYDSIWCYNTESQMITHTLQIAIHLAGIASIILLPLLKFNRAVVCQISAERVASNILKENAHRLPTSQIAEWAAQAAEGS